MTGSSSQIIQDTIDSLARTFALKDLGDLHYFLGVEVRRTKDVLHLSQSKYLVDLLKKFRLDGIKPCKTPMGATTKLTQADGEVLKNPTEYCSLVGALQYLCITRPDISYSVNKICQFLKFPTSEHFKAAKRIV